MNRLLLGAAVIVFFIVINEMIVLDPTPKKGIDFRLSIKTVQWSWSSKGKTTILPRAHTHKGNMPSSSSLFFFSKSCKFWQICVFRALIISKWTCLTSKPDKLYGRVVSDFVTWKEDTQYVSTNYDGIHQILDLLASRKCTTIQLSVFLKEKRI